jgi:plasmid stabilization system protein ParE
MSAYALTPLAKADILDIWRYIADDSEATEGLRRTGYLRILK